MFVCCLETRARTMSSEGCYFACCCAVLYLLVQSTSTGELEILWPALRCRDKLRERELCLFVVWRRARGLCIELSSSVV